MEGQLKRTEAQKNKQVTATAVRVLLIVCLAILAIGCNEASRRSRGFGSSKTTPVRAQAVRIIRQALSDQNPDIRFKAIEVVAATRQSEMMPMVQRLLQDYVAPVRFAAALAVGDLRYSPAKKPLSLLLQDEDANVILAACYAMGKLGSTEYFEVLHKAIKDEDQTVRANAALLLGKSGDRTAIPLLYEAMQSKDSADKVTFQAAESLARLGDEQIYPKLWAMLISAYADLRLAGIGAMGLLGTSQAENALITMLDDDVPEIRLAAAEQLGMLNRTIGEKEVLEAYEKNVANGPGLDREAHDRINSRTAMAIGQIGTPALKKLLPDLLKDESQFVRIAAAKAVLQSNMR